MPTFIFAGIIEDFEDGDWTNNPTWWISENVGSGLITSDPVRPDNLVWKAYGTDTAHRILSTDVSDVSWDSFDISLDYKTSSSGNFHGAIFLTPEAGIDGSFRIGLWHDTQKDPDVRIYIIEYGPSVQDIKNWIPIGNIPRDQWLTLHAWYDADLGLITAETRVLETDMLLGQVSVTPHMNLSQSGDIEGLGIGIEETTWQYMDNVALIPEPLSITILALGGMMILRRRMA